MAILSPYQLDNLASDLRDMKGQQFLSSPEVVDVLIDYIERNLIPELRHPEATWQAFKAFWPPRCVDALRSKQAVVFFGAGLSIDAGIPSWQRLLSENFGLDKSLIEDEDLKADPLTLAELASQYLGNETLQQILRELMNRPKTVSLGHVLLAALRCRIYITTNYDCLLERAWERINGPGLVVVTNDADLNKDSYRAGIERGTILYKIHGSSSLDRADEHMILTRRDYRNHYRRNENFFDGIREHLRTKHTLFVGFSHKDPEVSRLVEDAIYDFEQTRTSGLKPNQPTVTPYRPQFYSLQFDMRAHTPEVFAARGIVALTPPVVGKTIENVKTTGMAMALTDLIGAKQYNLHERVALDQCLRDAIDRIHKPLASGLECISRAAPIAKAALEGTATNEEWLHSLGGELGPLASQGVFLLNDQGRVVAFGLPPGLDETVRTPRIAFNQRPYFKQAKSFREAFVSDTAESVYNKRSTFFLCVPLLDREQMIGLLFSASQVGQWTEPINVAKDNWANDRTFLLVDSNGVCVVPPLDEFSTTDYPLPTATEVPSANVGYPYAKLLSLSRRDTLVRHVSKSVVPITQDDDVLALSADFRQFTIVSEIPKTRWKIGVSVPVGMR